MNQHPGAPSGGDLLALYLNDHLTGASVGVHLFRRAAQLHHDRAARETLIGLSREVNADRDTLIALMKRLDVSPQRHRMALGWAAEKAGRLKPNGTLIKRSPLSDVVELETLRLGVEGKACVWKLLALLADSDPRISADELDELEQRARHQIDALEELRMQTARSVFER